MASSTGDTQGSRKPASAKRRQEIMQAAERLFTSRRFHEITMDDVAASAGVAKGTLYRYFHDKDELFFATTTNGFEELCDVIERKVPGAGAFSQRLLGACREISLFFEHRHQLLRMMQIEEGRMCHLKGAMRQRWMKKRRMLIAAMAGIISDGAAGGVLRKDVPAEVLASMLLGLLRARAHDLADASPAHRRHELVVELFVNGAGSNRVGDCGISPRRATPGGQRPPGRGV